ncbi:LAGLIDADG family homing endonuclease, partial [candidate division WOR-3 bacterium]|nr:LAGLIDADG family homing endonuclease [candidate division WOR-3 bacterium]
YMENKYSYLAGLLDGEGWLGITKVKSRYKRGSGYTYKARIVIANCNLSLLEEIKKEFGGYIAKTKKGKPNWSQGYRLHMRDIGKWLPKVIPYLIGKKKKAILLLEACKLLEERKKKTNQAGNLHTERLDEISQMLKKKEWLI